MTEQEHQNRHAFTKGLPMRAFVVVFSDGTRRTIHAPTFGGAYRIAKQEYPGAMFDIIQKVSN